MRTESSIKILLTTVLLTAFCALSVLAQPFNFSHVGGGATGYVVPNGGGSFTFVGGGHDIWDMADEFDYAHVTVTGDFDVQVRAESLQPTARWSKAGIMARESLAGDSRKAFVRVTPPDVGTQSGGNGANDTRYAYRTGIPGAGGNGGQHEDCIACGSPQFPNGWLRLQRTGDHLLAYQSTDGSAWTLLGDQDTATWNGGAMPATLMLGLAVSRHSGPIPTARAEFRDFQITSGDVRFEATKVSTRGNPNGVYVYYSKPYGANGLDFTLYEIPGITVNSASAGPDANTVLLNVSGLVLDTSYDLTIFGVVDGGGTPIANDATPIPFRHGDDIVGRFCSTFDALPNGMTIYGNAAVDSGILKLTPAANSQFGIAYINDFAAGQPVNQIHAKFDAGLFGSTCCGGGTLPADGFSINLVPVAVENPGYGNPAEEGLGNGLAVNFDTWDNGGGEAPAIDVKWNNSPVPGAFAAVQVSQSPAGAPDFDTAKKLVEIDLNADGKITVKYGGVTYINNVQTPYVPIGDGRWVLGARTGGANDNHWIDNLCIQTFRTVGNVSVAISPSTQTVTEGQPFTLTADIDGTPSYSIQWYRSDTGAIPGANGATYTAASSRNDVGVNFYCAVNNHFSSAQSGNATLDVLFDNTPPTLLGCSDKGTLTQILLNFSEPVDTPESGDPFNYSIDPPLGVLGVSFPSPSQVLLTTDPQAEGATYMVTAGGVTDRAGNLIGSPNNCSFTALVFSPCFCKRELYGGGINGISIGGVLVSDLRNHPTYPNSPTLSDIHTLLEGPTDVLDNYGIRLSGFIVATTAGPHRFFISADDEAHFLMSNNEDPAGLTMIAREPQWNGSRQFRVADRRGVPPENDSETLFPGGIMLNAGERRYFEALMKEGIGGDNVSVAVQPPGGAEIVNGSTPVGGFNLGLYASPVGAPTITITQEPADQMKIRNQTATFTVAANNSGNAVQCYQWFRQAPGGGAFEPIAGANGTSYTTPPVQLSDDGTHYQCVVYVLGNSKSSREALLSVSQDVTPPHLLSAASANGTQVGVCFDELIDPVSATDPFNWDIPGAIISSISVRASNGKEVVILLDPGTPVSGTFTVTAHDVFDLSLNVVDPNPATVNGVRWLENVEDMASPAPAGTHFTCNPCELEISTGGADIWGTSDQGTFAYKTIVNNFDINVRVDRLDYVGNPWSKGGIMVRSSTDPASPMVWTYPTPPAGANQIETAIRLTTGANVIDFASRPNTISFPVWVRVKRIGTTIYSYYSRDGVTWLDKGVYDAPQLPPVMLAGVAAVSHLQGTATTAKFCLVDTVLYPDAQITCSQPTDVTVEECHDATVTVTASVEGAPASELQYQWEVKPPGGSYSPVLGAAGTGPTLVLGPLTSVDDGTMVRCTAFVAGASSQCGETTIHMVPDNTPPTCVLARGTASLNQIILYFSERVDPTTATDPFNYLVPVGAISLIELNPDGASVTITLDTAMDVGSTHCIEVGGVTDICGGNVLDPNPCRRCFQNFIPSRGCVNAVKQEIYQNMGGVNVTDLTNNAAYPNSPTIVRLRTSMEANTFDEFDNYGSRLSGYLVPPVSGNYHFALSADDGADFLLSTDSNPANVRVICREPTWNGRRDWLGTARRNAAAPENRSTTLYPAGIPLVAGQLYYCESRMKEGGGGDNQAVTWQIPGQPPIVGGQAPIPASFVVNIVEGLADPTGATITTTQDPQDMDVVANTSFSLSAAATGVNANGPACVLVTWEKDDGSGNFLPVPGIVGSPATFFAAAQAPNCDMVMRFRAKFEILGAVAYSEVADVHIVPDTTPPQVVSARRRSTDKVDVVFNEPLDPDTASDNFNYSINNGVSVMSAALNPDGRSVRLMTTPLANLPCDNYVVTVNNVADACGNPVAANSQAEIILTDSRAPVGADNLIVIEAETFDAQRDAAGHTWLFLASGTWLPASMTSGEGFMYESPDNGGGNDNVQMDYVINFPVAGTWYIGMRGDSRDGGANSCHVLLNGARVVDAMGNGGEWDDNGIFRWVWYRGGNAANRAQFTVPSAGVHTLTIGHREDGFRVDKFILTTSATIPPGIGNGSTALGPNPPPATQNQAPSFDVAINPVCVDEDAGLVTIPGVFTNIKAGPPSESGQTVQFEIVDQNCAPGLLLGGGVAPDGTVTLLTAPNACGECEVTVVLKDNGGSSCEGDTSPPATIRVCVRPVPDCPVTEPQVAAMTCEDTTVAIAISASDVDSYCEAETLTYALSDAPAYGTATIADNVVSYTPARDYCGPDSLKVTVSDGQCSVEATVNIDVKCVNDPPVCRITAGPLLRITPDVTACIVLSCNNQCGDVTLDGSLSYDPEGGSLSYIWLDNGNPIGNTATLTTCLSVGTHVITLIVDDGGAGTDPACTDEGGTTRCEKTVTVIDGNDAIDEIVTLVENSNIGRKNKRPLIATLKASAASFVRGNCVSGVNQLEAFVNKVAAQLKDFPATQTLLTNAAQAVIDAFNACCEKGNNGLGNGLDPQPPGDPPPNDQ